MQTSNYFQSKKVSLKLTLIFVLALLVLFLLLTLSFYNFEDYENEFKTSSEKVNIVKVVRRSLKSSASSPDEKRIEDSASIAVKKPAAHSFMETLMSPKVEGRVRKAGNAKAGSSITFFKPYPETQTYNKYEDPLWQSYGSYSNSQMGQKQPPKYALQKHLRRRPTNIKQRNPPPKAPKTSLQPKKESWPSEALFKQIKMLWNMFEFFTWAWNALAEYYNSSQRQQQQQQQRQELQMQTRINLTKLPQRAQHSSELTTFKTNFSRLEKKGEVQPLLTTGSREKRQTKNAPLKSYYDFVIVEASHKFWSIFEIASIIIVIYSTFAALYFAKLNPLVSKHDYIDYISGDSYFGNSRRANDIDFEDNEDNDEDDDDDDKIATTLSHATHYDWLPSIGYSIKFVMDAIDKLPADLGQE